MCMCICIHTNMLTVFTYFRKGECFCRYAFSNIVFTFIITTKYFNFVKKAQHA